MIRQPPGVPPVTLYQIYSCGLAACWAACLRAAAEAR